MRSTANAIEFKDTGSWNISIRNRSIDEGGQTLRLCGITGAFGLYSMAAAGSMRAVSW